ncbi:MAG: response regulator, partial [Pyrinomonadaceae bacterium]|nr:response regulator [Sphingobacteriaceae bacterium]
ENILIVEDDPLVREVLQLLLTEAHYNVTSCSTGKNIFETVSKSRPDLILLDVCLGEVDGRDLCKILKSHQDTKKIPIIIVSGNYNAHNIVLDQGANDALLKPFTEPELLSRIQLQLLKAG